MTLMSATAQLRDVELLWCGCPLVDVAVPTYRDPYRARDMPCAFCGETIPAARDAFYVRVPGAQIARDPRAESSPLRPRANG